MSSASKHSHDWKFSYSIKSSKGTEVVYYCKACEKFKRNKGEAPVKKRQSNMGGEFSTNWSDK
jgi:hypothetical protein